MDTQALLRSTARLSLVAVAAFAAVSAHAAAGDIVVRARVLQMNPANEAFGPVLGTSSATDVTVSDRKLWEVDASYFVTDNVALELIAPPPPKHTVSLGGTRLGTVRHLPPVLTAQYHFAPTNPVVRPYVGFGVNYTHFSAVDLNLSGTELDIKRHSWGTAFQMGADFPITDKLSFNVDFKKVDIRTDVKIKSTGDHLGTIKIDPVLFGIGLGYKF